MKSAGPSLAPASDPGKTICGLACQAKRFGPGLCRTPKCTDALSSQRNTIHDGIYNAGRGGNGNTNQINKTLGS